MSKQSLLFLLLIWFFCVLPWIIILRLENDRLQAHQERLLDDLVRCVQLFEEPKPPKKLII